MPAKKNSSTKPKVRPRTVQPAKRKGPNPPERPPALNNGPSRHKGKADKDFSANALVSSVRKSFGLNRKLFSRLTGFSERAISGWEQGAQITEPGLRKMRELQRLYLALGQVMKPDFISQWLSTPSEEFDAYKPIEIIERGEMDRIWQMIYYLESGMPI